MIHSSNSAMAIMATTCKLENSKTLFTQKVGHSFQYFFITIILKYLVGQGSEMNIK